MKKILGVSLVALMAVSTARADIVAKSYVDVDQSKTYNVITKTAKTGVQIEELDAKMGALPSNKTIAQAITDAVTGGTENVVTHSGAVGTATQPVYITSEGVATAGTALGDAAYKGIGAVADGDTDLVTGDAVYEAIARQDFSGKQDNLGGASDAGKVVTATSTAGTVSYTAIDTTTGGTASSSDLITSGAVNAGLALKQDTIPAGTYVGTVTTDANGGNVVTAVSANTNGTVSVTTGNAIMETSATGTDGVSVLTRTVDGTTGAVTYKWETIARTNQ